MIRIQVRHLLTADIVYRPAQFCALALQVLFHLLNANNSNAGLDGLCSYVLEAALGGMRMTTSAPSLSSRTARQLLNRKPAFDARGPAISVNCVRLSRGNASGHA